MNPYDDSAAYWYNPTEPVTEGPEPEEDPNFVAGTVEADAEDIKRIADSIRDRTPEWAAYLYSLYKEKIALNNSINRTLNVRK